MILTPLALWTIFFVLGIAAGNHAGDARGIFFFFVIASLCGAGYFLRTKTRSRAFLFALAFFLGAARVMTAQMLSADHISRALTNEKKGVVLEGEVVSSPRISKTQVSFLFCVDHYHNGSKTGTVRGRVWARCFSRVTFSQGEHWLLEGSLMRPSGPLARIMASMGASAILSIPRSGRCERISQRGIFWQRWAPDAMAQKIGSIFSGSMDPMSAGLYRAMILGEKRMVPKAIKTLMVRTGTWHIMVVSGSHTAFLAGILLVLLKIFRVPRRGRFSLTIAILIIYCLMTGATSPVVRATVMTTAFLISFIVERNPVFLHSLALSALLILALDPVQLFDVGFQLSFLSVFFIVVLSPRLMPRGLIKKISGWPRLARDGGAGLINCLVVSFSAWIGTAPLIYYVFGYFSPVAIAANTAVVPFAMIVTAAGFALVPITLIIPAAAPIMAQAASYFMELFIRVNALFS